MTEVIQVKILSAWSPRENSKTGDIFYICYGITSLSKLVIVTSSIADAKVTKDGFIMLRNFYLSPSKSSSDYVAVNLRPTTKILRLAPFAYDVTVEETFLYAPIKSLGDALSSPEKTRFSLIATVTEIGDPAALSRSTGPVTMSTIVVLDKATTATSKVVLFGPPCPRTFLKRKCVVTNLICNHYKGKLQCRSTDQTTIELAPVDPAIVQATSVATLIMVAYDDEDDEIVTIFTADKTYTCSKEDFLQTFGQMPVLPSRQVQVVHVLEEIVSFQEVPNSPLLPNAPIDNADDSSEGEDDLYQFCDISHSAGSTAANKSP